MTDSDEEENFAEYGTPLEPLDEDALPKKKPFTLEDQVVTDKQGRRRFHGAFTGGFSAGFFNTVGSLEGWTPSSFKSSRQEKAGSHVQKAEDFMDDEDMEEFGIAPKVLRAKEDFRDHGQKRGRKTISDGPIPGEPVLKDILQPVRETVGVKLLKKMGWKPGQGVGPRLTKREKTRLKRDREKEKGKIYGCALPPSDQGPETSQTQTSDDDSENENITFAPDDYEPFLCMPKDNCFGIGYSGLDKRPVLSTRLNLFEPSILRMEEKRKKISISGQAFGVGAFEEEDEDIYSRDDMSQYDFSLASSSKTSDSKESKPTAIPNYVGDVLDGFVLSSVPRVKKKYFPPPDLPRDFKGLHITRKSRFGPPLETFASSTVSIRKGLERHALVSSDRAAILGEVSSTKVSESANNEKHEIMKEARQVTEQLLATAPELDFKNFKPFVADPDKQKRYEQYLSLIKIGNKDRLSYLQPFTMTEWEKERERTEFEQAAKLYRPLAGDMNDRFVSASKHDDATNPLAVVEKLDHDKDLQEAVKMKMYGPLTRKKADWKPSSLLCKLFNIPEPILSGATERSDATKKPLLKFTVFDYLDASRHNTFAEKPEINKLENSKENEIEKGATLSVSNDAPDTIADDSEEKEENMDNADKNSSLKSLTELSVEFPDPPEKIDLYKAIFLSSSEDSESDSEEENAAVDSNEKLVESDTRNDEKTSANKSRDFKNDTPNMSSLTMHSDIYTDGKSLLSTATTSNILKNPVPARGVFANIDLDAINSRKRDGGASEIIEKPILSEKPDSKPETSSEINDTVAFNEDMYGPKLPTTITSAVSSSSSIAMSNTVKKLPSVIGSKSVWVEKTKDRNHDRKHKKSSKHKKHKSKKKHKDKRH